MSWLFLVFMFVTWMYAGAAMVNSMSSTTTTRDGACTQLEVVRTPPSTAKATGSSHPTEPKRWQSYLYINVLFNFKRTERMELSWWWLIVWAVRCSANFGRDEDYLRILVWVFCRWRNGWMRKAPAGTGDLPVTSFWMELSSQPLEPPEPTHNSTLRPQVSVLARPPWCRTSHWTLGHWPALPVPCADHHHHHYVMSNFVWWSNHRMHARVQECK